jgi:hypothetical protein
LQDDTYTGPILIKKLLALNPLYLFGLGAPISQAIPVEGLKILPFFDKALNSHFFYYSQYHLAFA